MEMSCSEWWEGEEGRPAARLQRGPMMEGSVGRERESGLRWMLARVRWADALGQGCRPMLGDRSGEDEGDLKDVIESAQTRGERVCPLALTRAERANCAEIQPDWRYSGWAGFLGSWHSTSSSFYCRLIVPSCPREHECALFSYFLPLFFVRGPDWAMS